VSSTAGEERARAFRDRPLGRLAILAVVLIVALLVAKTCGATETDISQEQAIVIARDAVDYTPNNEMVRLLKRGLSSEEFWAVSLSIKQSDGTLENVTVVVVDAHSGEIVEIRKEG
jgi:hypothetical protein